MSKRSTFREPGTTAAIARTALLAAALAAAAIAMPAPSAAGSRTTGRADSTAPATAAATLDSARGAPPAPSRGVSAPAPPAAFDTLRAVRQPDDTTGAAPIDTTDETEPSPTQFVVQDYRAAMAAYRVGDYARYKSAMERAVALEPGHPILMYHLARACARLGLASEALGWLNRMADTGVVIDIAANEDLASLRDSTSFHAVQAKMDSNRTAEGSADVVFRIREPNLMPEGIAYDPASGSILVSSIYKRKILRVASDGTITDFITAGQDSFWCGVGMKVDDRRRLLWACSGASVMMRGATAADTSRTGLFAFDLETGATRGKYVLPDTTVAHFLNDLVIAPNGDIYATDSDQGGVWRLPADGLALERFVPDHKLEGSNGIALSEDGRLLYVSEYTLGISVIDLATRRISRLEHLEVLATAYVDGLYCRGNSLIAVQNSQGLARVMRFYLDPAGQKITGGSIVAANLTEFDEPTTGVIVGPEFYFIANSELNRFGPDGTLKPLSPPQDFLIMRARY